MTIETRAADVATSEAGSQPPVAARGAVVGADSVVLHLAGLTDVGHVREHNEDNLLVADLTPRARCELERAMKLTVGPSGLLLVVCDGMGGAAAGEVASQMAAEIVYEVMTSGPAPGDREHFAQRLVGAIREAGTRIYLAAKSNRSQRGMGTTVTAAGVYGNTLFVGQVGDSRAYLLRDGALRQLTRDQSLVCKLIEAGQFTEAEAEDYEYSNIILQALGTTDVVAVDLTYVELSAGDTLMLCSDGLSGLVSADEMRAAMSALTDPMACCKRLVDAALHGGGHDNVTVIAARFEGELPAEGSDFTGYEPYVLFDAPEVFLAATAATSMKEPDLPPPGSAAKHSASLPPDAPSPTPLAADLPRRRDEAIARPARVTGSFRGPRRRLMLAVLLAAVAFAAWCVWSAVH
jgi:protein phosphatase